MSLEKENTLEIARTMIKYGGSFVKNLGQALLVADPENTRIIKESWPEYWERYESMSRMD